MVSWVPGSPIDCAAITPTASPWLTRSSMSRFGTNEGSTHLTLEVLPVQNLPIATRVFLVLFVVEPDPSTEVSDRLRIEAALSGSAEEKDREIQQTRQDLAATARLHPRGQAVNRLGGRGLLADTISAVAPLSLTM